MNESIFRLQPWDPNAQELAERLIGQIHDVAPELEVLFMGAVALGLPGKNDIDLDILCDTSEVRRYTEKLIPLLGHPKVTKSNLISWESEVDGFEVDCILSDPRTSHVPLQQKRFEILKSNSGLRNEYKQLKENSDGLPFIEYEKRKQAFLEEKVFSSKLF
jgi:hypothetical protein